MSRLRNTGINLGIVLTCVAFVVLMAPVPAHVPSATTVFDRVPDIPDLPDSGILAANLSATLVEQGTVTPYLGEGAPGLVLQVKVPNISRALNWTLEGWANQTTTPALQVCKHGYHFSSLDWMAVTDLTSDSKTYLTVSASPLRMTPDGDQCPARALAFGTWEVKVRMDHLLGGPANRYEAPDGWHNDTWDRSDTWTFQVPV